MEAIASVHLLPQILLLAVIGFVAFYSSCAFGLRAGWLAYRPSLCGALGGLGGAAIGLIAAAL
jgi:hypothetical protein